MVWVSRGLTCSRNAIHQHKLPDISDLPSQEDTKSAKRDRHPVWVPVREGERLLRTSEDNTKRLVLFLD